MKTKRQPITISESPDLPFAPRLERLDNPPARPWFRTVYGESVKTFRDDLDAFEEHGRNLRHAAECAGLLETP